ncbi:MAG: hypothetical protein WCJ06_13130 [Planctomycetota bacterium]
MLIRWFEPHDFTTLALYFCLQAHPTALGGLLFYSFTFTFTFSLLPTPNPLPSGKRALPLRSPGFQPPPH